MRSAISGQTVATEGSLRATGGLGTDRSREAALRDEIARLQAALRQARQAALVDPLTGSLNRRGWDKGLAGEERRCRRHGLDAVVVMVDLDGLKTINDVRGHAAGDRAIVACARALQAAVRAEDLVARLGGDEFAVLAVQTDSESAQAVVANVERALGAAGIPAGFGWALRSEHAGLAAAVDAADHGLVAMKRRRSSRAPGAAAGGASGGA